MSHMFENNKVLKSLDLSCFNIENVKDMSCMFYFCISLLDLNISNFNTSQVTNMAKMFFYS